MSQINLTDLPPALQAATVRRTLTKGQILVQKGEVAGNLYWVVAGRLHLTSFVNQRMITYYSVEAGELFGEIALHVDTYGCTAIAEVDSEVVAIPKTGFATALQQSPVLGERYLAHLTYRFHSVKALLELRSISSARERLLHYLMQRLSPGQATVTLEKPLKAVASELALTPEGFSRLLSRLQMEGVIARRQRRITFSEEWLESMSE